MAAKKETEGLVFLLDVGQAMTTRSSSGGSLSYLQSCLNIVQMIVERKMYQASKDEVSLVLFGTRDTANPLWESGSDRYSHVTVVRPLAPVDWNMIDYVQKRIEASNIDGDVLDGLIVAANELNGANKVYSDKRIYVFTDFSSGTSDPEQVKDICKGFENESIHVFVISPFDDEDDDGGGGGSGDEDRPKSSKEANRQTNGTRHARKALTKSQEATRELLKRIATQTDGSLNSFGNVMELLSLQQSKSVRSAGTKYEMTIGESFKLPVVAMICAKENRPELFRMKKVYAKDESVELKADKTRLTKDDEQRDLGKDETVDAFRYGSTIVPIANEDGLKLNVEKCFSVLGFTKSENIKRYYYLGESIHQIMTDQSAGEGAEEAFVNMVHAMYNEDVCGLVRKVYSKASSPEMGALIPHITSDYVCLLYVSMPYDDDIRKFPLTSFTALDKFKPSERQLKLVDQLIDAMDLKKPSGGGNDDDADENEEEELYDPHKVFNPTIQRMYQSISARASNPQCDLPDFEQHLTARKRKQMDEHVRNDHVKRLLEQCANEFPLKVNEKKLTKQQQQQQQAADNIFSENKTKDKCSDLLANVNDSSSSSDLIKPASTAAEVSSVGTQTPVEDFKALADKCGSDEEAFDDLCVQIQARVREFLRESLTNSVLNDESANASYLQMAADCVRAMRSYCVKLKRADTFNQFAQTFKIYLTRDSTNRKYAKQIAAFWLKYFREAELTLISKDEEPSSEITRQEAQEFLDFGKSGSELSASKATVDVKDEENVENLLDLM